MLRLTTCGPGRAPVLLAAVAALAAVALWLTFDNPEIDGTSRGAGYTCLAPWDTVLNDADNSPGGEPPPDSAEIAARCRDAGHDRFGWAVASWSTAAALAAWAAGSIRRGPRGFRDGRACG